MAKILVMGATGSIGSEVVKALAKKDVHFKAAVHNVSKAEALKKISSKIEPVEVDVYNPATLAKAFEGIESIFALTPPGQTFPGLTHIVDEAVKAHVKYIVRLSACGCEDPEWIWGADHLKGENLLKASGITTTFLRPTAFMTNMMSDIKTIKEHGKIFSTNAFTKVNYIAPSDIGEAAAAILTNPSLAGKTYDIMGPDTLSTTETAAIRSELIGKEIQVVIVDDDTLRKNLSSFMSPAAMEPLVNMMQRLKAGIYNRTGGSLHELIGREGLHVKEWLAAGPIHAFTS